MLKYVNCVVINQMMRCSSSWIQVSTLWVLLLTSKSQPKSSSLQLRFFVNSYFLTIKR